jgi:protein-disulfide isomerase
MAGQLKPFYIGLALVAVAGAALIYMARRSGSETTAAQTAPGPVDLGDYEGHVMGSDSAPVTIIEYADFECPACAQFAVLTGPDVKQRLVATGQVRWIFRDFPLDGHRNTMAAHHAAQCAGEQGRFWEMHDQIFFNHGRWVPERRPEGALRDLAAAARVDLRSYDDCMSSGRYMTRLEQLRADAAARGVSSTPTFDIGGRRVSGALLYDDLKKLVESAAGAK